MRKKLLKTKEAEILFQNRHTCCICHDKNKDVQIHHIDNNNSNNNLKNLAVLCLDCHSKVTGKRGLGKSYSELELKRYKQEWEVFMKGEAGLSPFQKPRNIPKIEKQLFVFEIKRIIYQMISTDDSNKEFLDKGFETLWNISLLENVQKKLLSTFNMPSVSPLYHKLTNPLH